MYCPKCKAENEDTRETCKKCGIGLKHTVNASITSSFIPVDTPGRVGDYTKDDFVNVTAGTELWKRVGWKGALVFMIGLIILASILFIFAKLFF